MCLGANEKQNTQSTKTRIIFSLCSFFLFGLSLSARAHIYMSCCLIASCTGLHTFNVNVFVRSFVSFVRSFGLLLFLSCLFMIRINNKTRQQLAKSRHKHLLTSAPHTHTHYIHIRLLFIVIALRFGPGLERGLRLGGLGGCSQRKQNHIGTQARKHTCTHTYTQTHIQFQPLRENITDNMPFE